MIVVIWKVYFPNGIWLSFAIGWYEAQGFPHFSICSRKCVELQKFRAFTELFVEIRRFHTMACASWFLTSIPHIPQLKCAQDCLKCLLSVRCNVLRPAFAIRAEGSSPKSRAETKISWEPLGLWAGRGDPSACSMFGDPRGNPNKQTFCGKMRRDWQQDCGEHVENMWRTCGGCRRAYSIETWDILHSGLPLDEFNGQMKKLKAMPKDEKPTLQFWTFASISFPLGKEPKICEKGTQKGWLKENNNEEKEDATSLAQAGKSCTSEIYWKFASPAPLPSQPTSASVPSLKRLERSRGSLLQDWSQKQWREMARIWMFVVPFADYCTLPWSIKTRFHIVHTRCLEILHKCGCNRRKAKWVGPRWWKKGSLDFDGCESLSKCQCSC